MIDHRRYKHNLSSCDIKAWKLINHASYSKWKFSWRIGKKLLFSFIWDGEGDKIAKKTIIMNDIEGWEIKMTDIRSLAKSLKISWIGKEWDIN